MTELTEWEKKQVEEPLLLKGKNGARGVVRGTPTITLSTLRDASTDAILWPDPQSFTADENRKLQIMQGEGFMFPTYTMQVCKVFEIPLFVECAYLVIESFNGQNIWHNDDTWMVGSALRAVDAETVYEHTYNVYTVYRSKFGYQGVGPNGLTSKPFQDRGDFYGGAWHPRSNMAGACSWFAERRTAGDTWDEIAHAYNPGSSTYVERHQEQRKRLKALFAA